MNYDALDPTEPKVQTCVPCPTSFAREVLALSAAQAWSCLGGPSSTDLPAPAPNSGSCLLHHCWSSCKLARTHARAHAHARARTHAHTHTHTNTRAHTCTHAWLQGEILIRSGSNFSGYYKAQDKTDEVLEKDGWFHTGGCSSLPVRMAMRAAFLSSLTVAELAATAWVAMLRW